MTDVAGPFSLDLCSLFYFTQSWHTGSCPLLPTPCTYTSLPTPLMRPFLIGSHPCFCLSRTILILADQSNPCSDARTLRCMTCLQHPSLAPPEGVQQVSTCKTLSPWKRLHACCRLPFFMDRLLYPLNAHGLLQAQIIAELCVTNQVRPRSGHASIRSYHCMNDRNDYRAVCHQPDEVA